MCSVSFKIFNNHNNLIGLYSAGNHSTVWTITFLRAYTRWRNL